MKVYIQLKDKETSRKSKKVPLEEIIYNQNEVEFEFGNLDDEDYEAIPYDDFLFFKNDYEVICKVENLIEKV